MTIKTVEDLKNALPSGTKFNVSEDMLLLVQGMGGVCEIEQEYMEESFLSHIPSLKGMNVEMGDYIDAIKFCNLKQRMSNVDAWRIVFRRKLHKISPSTHSQNVHIYNKKKLIQKIDADMAVALHIQYAPMRHKSIQHQFNLMNGVAAPSLMPIYKKKKNGEYIKDKYQRKIQVVDSNGEPVFEEVWMVVTPKIQQEAGKAVFELTKIPEDKNINIKIGLTDEAIESNREMTDKFAEIAMLQRRALENGASIDDVQRIGHIISDAEIEE